MNSPHIMVLGSSKGKEPNPDPAILNRKALQEETKKKKKEDRQLSIILVNLSYGEKSLSHSVH